MTALSDQEPRHLAEVLIVAGNAEATIEDAILSIREASAVSVLLIDNGCTDNTVERARAAAIRSGLPFRTVALTSGGTVGQARNVALQNTNAEYCIWLDADDRFLGGRVEVLTSMLRNTGADYAFDGCLSVPVEKADRAEKIGDRHRVPSFLMTAGGESRLYERNWLPALTGAVRTSTARKVGYDAKLTSAEDYDHLLRAMLAGARLSFTDRLCYIYCDHPGSLSRDLEKSRRNSAAVLAKLPIPEVYRDMERRGLSADERDLIVAAIHAQTGRWEELLQLSQSANHEAGWSDIWQWDTWMHWCFLEGNSLLQLKETTAAMERYQRIVAEAERAEVFNNIGLCHALSGNQRAAEDAWRFALSLKPNYADATMNLADATSGKMTVLPLRHAPVRDDYAPR